MPVKSKAVPAPTTSESTKKEPLELSSLDASLSRKIARLGDNIARLSAEIDEREKEKEDDLKMLSLLRERNNIDHNIRGSKWTYRYRDGSLLLKETLLVESGVSVKTIAACKRRGAGSWSVIRDREKKENAS